MSRKSARVQLLPEAVDHLRAADPVLRGVIDRVGVFEPSHEPDLWRSLVDAIVSQQLSVRAAATIFSRVAALGGDTGFPGPEIFLREPDEVLRGCGLSRPKIRYLRDLASRWQEGFLDSEHIRRLPDEGVIEELTRVKGIGRWTAEMVLIFTLHRPDVLPVDDLGLRRAVETAYQLPERPAAAFLYTLAEPWRPFRSTATLFLWRSLNS